MAIQKSGSRVCGLLVVIIAALLPITTLLLWFNYAAVVLADQRNLFLRRKNSRRKTVLITGSSNAHGLNLARAFHQDGHRVVGADQSSKWWLSTAKQSRAVAKHYNLPQLSATQDESYIARCIYIITRREKVDVWIDASQDLTLRTITTARKEVEAGTACACVALDSSSAEAFHDRGALLYFLRRKDLPAPELHKVKSRSEIHNVLNGSQGKKQFRLTTPTKVRGVNAQTLLPKRTLSETYHNVSLVKIASDSEAILEEYFDTTTTYHCYSLVVRGALRAFFVVQKAQDQSYSMGSTSALWQALRAYTDCVARAFGEGFSGHLSLTFSLDEKFTQAGVIQQILPIQGSSRFDPAFIVPIGPKHRSQLVNIYLTAVTTALNGSSNSSLQQSNSSANPPLLLGEGPMPRQKYFLLDDVVRLVLRPCFQLCIRRTSLKEVSANTVEMLYRLLFWDEAYYVFWDPLPAFWQYTIVFPWLTLTGGH